MEEMGRRLVPGPFLGFAARGRRDRRGRQRHTARSVCCRPSRPATRSRRSRSAKPAASSRRSGVSATAEPAGGGYVLRGQKTHVLCGADADLVVAPFREASGQRRALRGRACPRRASRSKRRSASTRRGRWRASRSTACASRRRRDSTATPLPPGTRCWCAALPRSPPNRWAAPSRCCSRRATTQSRASSSIARSASSRP